MAKISGDEKSPVKYDDIALKIIHISVIYGHCVLLKIILKHAVSLIYVGVV